MRSTVGRFAVVLLTLLVAVCGIVATAPPAESAQIAHCSRADYGCVEGSGYGAYTSTWADTYYFGGEHNCTRYVAYRLARNGMPDPGTSWGNAGDWWTRAPGEKNLTPAIGAIAYWAPGKKPAGSYGHVAWVEAYQPDGSVTVTEDNAGWNSRHVTYSGVDGPSGYIHIRGSSQYFGDSPSALDPVGSLDEVSSPSPGKVKVRGWAFDRDALARSIDVHVYVGGGVGTAGVEGHALTANVSRPDVDSAHGVGALHGFDSMLATNKRGRQDVCVYAINIGGGDSVELGCRAVTIDSPPVGSNPVGSIDEVSSPAGAKVKGEGMGVRSRHGDTVDRCPRLHRRRPGYAGRRESRAHRERRPQRRRQGAQRRCVPRL